MNTQGIRESLDSFIEEGGLEKMDEMKEDLSSIYGKLADLADSLEKVKDDLDTDSDLHDCLQDCIAGIRKASHAAGDAHDHIADTNTEVIEDIGNIVYGE